MKFLRNIYYSQYYYSKIKGEEEKALLVGNVVVATWLIFVGAILFFVEMIFFRKTHIISDLLFEVFPEASARLNGRILGAILLLIVFLAVRFTIGTRKNYNKNIAYFNQQTVPRQRKLARKGTLLFTITCFIMILLMFMMVFSLS